MEFKCALWRPSLVTLHEVPSLSIVDCACFPSFSIQDSGFRHMSNKTACLGLRWIALSCSTTTAVLAQALLSMLQDKHGNLLWIDYATYEGTIRFPLLDIFMQGDDRLEQFRDFILEQARNHDDVSCRVFGKPDPEHFHACVRQLRRQQSPLRIAHVGDSLHHDIHGDNQAGIASNFVTSGIHQSELATAFGEFPSPERLRKLFQTQGEVTPNYVVPAFRL
jgi:HAD-hyrolase-like